MSLVNNGPIDIGIFVKELKCFDKCFSAARCQSSLAKSGCE